MEVMLATTLLGIILVGVLAAYLFLGRNLTRLVNLQHQENESRRTLRTFTQDVSAAIQLTTASTTQVVLTKPTSSTNATITYTYSSGAGTLVRNDGTTSLTMLSGLTALTFTYYNEAGTVVSGSPQSVKSVELSYSSAVGTATSGTLARYTSVSPRAILRNKTALQ
jgi:archaellin